MARKENNRIYLTESELNNMISETISLLLEGRPTKWNYETCYNEAKKYKSRYEFQQNNGGAYAAAIKNGWLDDYTWFEGPKPHGYWTREKCYEEAKNYKSQREFERGNASAFSAAYKNGWLGDYDWFEKGHVTDKNVYVVYCYKDDESNSVYIGLTNHLRRRHLQHCNGHMKHGEIKYDTVYKYFNLIGRSIPEPTILKQELYANEAQEYEKYYVNYFKEEGWNVLNIAKTGSLGALYKWTREKCYEEAKKYTTLAEFQKNAGSVYNAARKNGWLKEYVWLKRRKIWSREDCYKEASKYKTPLEFRKGNGGAYSAAWKNGWLNDYTWFEGHKVNGYWTQERCYNEAKKYKTALSFQNSCGGAYSAARRNDWLKDYTWFINPNIKWTREACYNEAKKYKGRSEFKMNASRAYRVALKNGWMDDYTWFNKPANKKTKNISLNELKSVIRNEVSNLLKEIYHKDL